jgi:acetylornithine deacetylase
MICDRCICAGYLELLPGDDLAIWKNRFERELRDELSSFGQDLSDIHIAFSEEYHGHRTDPEDALCRLAREVSSASVSAFNSGCEAGLRANMQNTPTLVWGPGSLRQAHAVDEFVQWDDVRRCAGMFASLALGWCGKRRGDQKGSE